MSARPRQVGDDQELKEYILDTINRLETLVSRLEVYAENSGEASDAHAQEGGESDAGSAG